MKPTIALFAAALAAFVAAAARPAPAMPIRDFGVAPASRPVAFTVKLPLRNRAELEELVRLQSTPESPIYGHFLTVSQFRARYGPTPDTLRRASLALAAQGFHITAINSQSIEVAGTAAAVRAAFNVPLHLVSSVHGNVVAVATGPLRPQPALAAFGATFIGITHVAERRSHARRSALPLNRESTLGTYWFTDLRQAYAYPQYATASGKGITIATVGGSDFSSSDANLYFEHEKLGVGTGYLQPQPTLVHKILSGGKAFSASDGDSFEADLDIQQAGGSAPGATIIGIATDATTDNGFIAAYTDIVEKKTGFVAQIVSTSYGECELAYTAAYNNGTDQTSILTEGYHDEFVQGNSEGITFVQSSGDNAGLDCPQAGYFTNPNANAKYLDVAGVEADADDPDVTGVGGTNLVTTYTSGSLNSAYVSENANDDTIGSDDPYGEGNTVTNELWGSGGGASKIFAKPSFQNVIATGVSTRAVPDIAMHMGGCPSGATRCSAAPSADYEYFGGQQAGVIGTSASAPEFAGLLAVRESYTKKALGNVNNEIYEYAKSNPNLGHKYFHQGIPGNNGVVTIKAGTIGYNTILGVGTPFGADFSGLASAPLAGIPQTATNP